MSHSLQKTPHNFFADSLAQGVKERTLGSTNLNSDDFWSGFYQFVERQLEVTVESLGSYLLPDGVNQFTDKQIQFMQNTKLSELDLSSSSYENPEDRSTFFLRKHHSDEYLLLNNRDSSNYELRGAYLRAALQKYTEDNPTQSLYDAIYGIGHDLKYSVPFKQTFGFFLADDALSWDLVKYCAATILQEVVVKDEKLCFVADKIDSQTSEDAEKEIIARLKEIYDDLIYDIFQLHLNTDFPNWREALERQFDKFNDSPVNVKKLVDKIHETTDILLTFYSKLESELAEFKSMEAELAALGNPDEKKRAALTAALAAKPRKEKELEDLKVALKRSVELLPIKDHNGTILFHHDYLNKVKAYNDYAKDFHEYQDLSLEETDLVGLSLLGLGVFALAAAGAMTLFPPSAAVMYTLTFHAAVKVATVKASLVAGGFFSATYGATHTKDVETAEMAMDELSGLAGSEIKLG